MRVRDVHSGKAASARLRSQFDSSEVCEVISSQEVSPAFSEREDARSSPWFFVLQRDASASDQTMMDGGFEEVRER